MLYKQVDILSIGSIRVLLTCLIAQSDWSDFTTMIHVHVNVYTRRGVRNGVGSGVGSGVSSLHPQSPNGIERERESDLRCKVCLRLSCSISFS